MKYAVHIPVTGYFSIELEAGSEQEAQQIAEQRFGDELCGDVYLPDDFVAVEQVLSADVIVENISDDD